MDAEIAGSDFGNTRSRRTWAQSTALRAEAKDGEGRSGQRRRTAPRRRCQAAAARGTTPPLGAPDRIPVPARRCGEGGTPAGPTFHVAAGRGLPSARMIT